MDLFRADRNVMLLQFLFFHLHDLFQEVLIVIGLLHEVDLGAVDREQRRFVVGEEKAVVGLGQIFQVSQVDVLLVGDFSLFDAVFEHVGGGLEEDHQVGLQDTGIQEIVEGFVEGEFVLGKIQERENFILGENIVGDHPLLEELLLGQFLLLTVAGEEKKDLGLKGVLGAVFVEVGKEGVAVNILQDHPVIEFLGQ